MKTKFNIGDKVILKTMPTGIKKEDFIGIITKINPLGRGINIFYVKFDKIKYEIAYNEYELVKVKE